MLGYNDRVKQIESGVVFRVVAPLIDNPSEVVVWADGHCKEVLILPFDSVEKIDEPFSKKQYAHLVYDVSTVEGEDAMMVNRKIDAVGLDGVVAVYADLRKYVAEIANTPIETIDELLKGEAK